MKETVKFIDLFAGMGGLRLGFEQALANLGLKGKSVFVSEIKKQMKEFVLAIKETREMFPIENMIDPDEWYEKVSTEYIMINDFNK